MIDGFGWGRCWCHCGLSILRRKEEKLRFAFGDQLRCTAGFAVSLDDMSLADLGISVPRGSRLTSPPDPDARLSRLALSIVRECGACKETAIVIAIEPWPEVAMIFSPDEGEEQDSSKANE